MFVSSTVAVVSWSLSCKRGLEDQLMDFKVSVTQYDADDLLSAILTRDKRLVYEVRLAT